MEDRIMDEMELQEKPGLFSRISTVFLRNGERDEEEIEPDRAPAFAVRTAYRYHVTVRKQIDVFDEAYAAANGLKRGDQQILNLTGTEPSLRQKIVDFMYGVCFAQDAHWEEIGQHIYLIAPASAYVETEPLDARSLLNN
ncbi:MAG: cell division protein SepF [Fimbriimonadaceae bacterium]|nr:cell division protein SepF [Fimbriimonadaceae bacterium]